MILEKVENGYTDDDCKIIKLPWRKRSLSLVCCFRDFIVRPMFNDKCYIEKNL